MYPYYGYDYRSENQTLLQGLTKAINGEYSAIACYEQLARLAPDEETRGRILEIRKDELRNYHVFHKCT